MADGVCVEDQGRSTCCLHSIAEVARFEEIEEDAMSKFFATTKAGDRG
jgi:hypothetical protein